MTPYHLPRRDRLKLCKIIPSDFMQLERLVVSVKALLWLIYPHADKRLSRKK